MSACERCAATLTVIQVYRGNRFCSVRCANWRGRALGHGKTELCAWERVLWLLQSQVGRPWFLTLADIALLEYGSDDRADINAARQSIYRIKRAGYALEERDVPWPTHERERIRGYRLARARKEQVA